MLSEVNKCVSMMLMSCLWSHIFCLTAVQCKFDINHYMFSNEIVMRFSCCLMCKVNGCVQPGLDLCGFPSLSTKEHSLPESQTLTLKKSSNIVNQVVVCHVH